MLVPSACPILTFGSPFWSHLWNCWICVFRSNSSKNFLDGICHRFALCSIDRSTARLTKDAPKDAHIAPARMVCGSGFNLFRALFKAFLKRVASAYAKSKNQRFKTFISMTKTISTKSLWSKMLDFKIYDWAANNELWLRYQNSIENIFSIRLNYSLEI